MAKKLKKSEPPAFEVGMKSTQAPGVTSPAPAKSPWIAGALSILPGFGHFYLGEFYRGGALLISQLIATFVVTWYGQLFWYIVPGILGMWIIWDAISLAQKGEGQSPVVIVLFGLVAALAIGWNVVQIDFSQASMERAIVIIQPMLRPDFIQERSEVREGWTPIEVPCSANPPRSQNTLENGVSMQALSDCGKIGDTIVVLGSGLWPDTETQIWWQTPIGDSIALGENETQVLEARSDENGNLSTTIRIPSTAMISSKDPTLSEEHRVYFKQYRPIGGYELSLNGRYVLQGISETLALALMATSLAVIVALPISFLAAHNLMANNPLTFAIYVVVRTILNIVRSIESLIVAIVFVVIVGLGPFAGVLALTVHSIAALGKLYSEVIEGIEPGPIEAIRATGANWLQVVRYGVIPQIIPPFTAFTIYRWDINVRMSTIIGFVGGGGIGFYLVQWIQINEMRAVSAAFIAIAVVVIILDYASAKIRERLV
jgi:phosphonate transport system permease protein